MLRTATLALIALLLLPAIAAAWLPRDEAGWSVVYPSSDSLVVYVDPVFGNDKNDGLSPEGAKRSFSEGYKLARSGYPDWVLLKGGVEHITSQPFIGWKDGRSPDEPHVIASYGEGRAIIRNDRLYATRLVNTVIRGIEIHNSKVDPNSPDYDPEQKVMSGISLTGYADNLLIEDCLIRFGSISIQGFEHSNQTQIPIVRNVVVRRSIVLDNYNRNGHAQGAFFHNFDNLLLEENTLDHNGWHPTLPGAQATIFNHNFYLQYSGTGSVFRGNFVSRAASHGAQLRSGGVAEDNFFYKNAIAFFLAASYSYTEPNLVYRNVVEGARDINTAPRGFGTDMRGALRGEWLDNAYINRGEASKEYSPIWIENDKMYGRYHNVPENPLPEGTRASVLIDNLYGWNWIGSERPSNITEGTKFNGLLRWPADPEVQSYYTVARVFSQGLDKAGNPVQHQDPTRNLDRYAVEVLDLACADDVLQWHRSRAAGEWRPEYSAESISAWIRAGFAIAGETDTPETPENPGESENLMSDLLNTPEARAKRAQADAAILSVSEQIDRVAAATRSNVASILADLDSLEGKATASPDVYGDEYQDAINARRQQIADTIQQVASELLND